MLPEKLWKAFVRSSHLLLALAVLVLLALVTPQMPVAHAATINVNSNLGIKANDGWCTLLEAIVNANNNAATWVDCPAGQVGPDTISLPAGATITLSVVDNPTNSIDEATGLPGTSSDITINGNGAIIERSTAGGTPNFRIFRVSSGTLTLNNVTVRNGKTGVAATTSGYGGGFEVLGTLVLNNSTITGNSTGDVVGSASSGYGGGINVESGATATINNSTISGNRIGSVVSGSAGTGGGISSNGGFLTLLNTTVSGNSTSSSGGGLRANTSVTGFAHITSSTITSNTAAAGGGIHISTAVNAILSNTIVALNTATVSGSNCSQAVTNSGNNLDSGTSCGWGSTNNSQSGVADPHLGPLANNGGATQTRALLPGSPAIDGVIYLAPNGSPATDQRGIARPKGARYDIGAFEFDPSEGLKTFLPLIMKH